MEHLYHGGWDCACMANPILEGGFQAVVTCRSLISGQVQEPIVDLLVHAAAHEALCRAREMAMKWACENRHSIQSLR